MRDRTFSTVLISLESVIILKFVIFDGAALIWIRPLSITGVVWKIRPPKKSPGGDFLTGGDRETFAPRRFIHDRRL